MARVVRSRTQNIGVSALARELDIPQSTVSHMLGRGKTVDDVRRYAAIKHGHAVPAKGMPADAPIALDGESKSEYDLILQTRAKVDELEEAKLRRAKALAEKQEIENAARRGELIPLGYVRRWAAKFLIDGRDDMIRLPSELADTLAAEKDPVRVRVILEQAMERILAKFQQLERLWKDNLEADKVAS